MSLSDPMALYSAAITQPPNSEEQFQGLKALRQSLEAAPTRIPMLLSTLISGLRNERGNSTMLRGWILDILAFTLSRSGLPWDTKAQGSSRAHPLNTSLTNESSWRKRNGRTWSFPV
jgi:symplekin